MSLTLTRLSNEQALLQCILFSRKVPQEFWYWLADRSLPAVCLPQEWSQPDIQSRISELIEPMLADAKPTERARHSKTPGMIAAIFRFTATRAEHQRWSFSNRMIAASLMPLYRCLATGELNEAMQQTRAALCESIALVGVASEIGSDIAELIERESCFGLAPHDCLQKMTNLQLSKLARMLVFAGSTWDHQDESQLIELVESAESESRIMRAANWANPAALWRLAGELMSKRAEFVMPREWINTPVPWGSVSEHWSSLEHLLGTIVARENLPNEPEGKREQEQPRASAIVTAPTSNSIEHASSISNDSCRLTDPAPVTSSNESSTKPSNAALAGQAQTLKPNSLSNSHASPEVLKQPNNVDVASEVVVPKVILGEVRSKNDSVFVNLVSRQLSTCRTEDRTVTLLAIRVEPEEEQDRQRLSGTWENGLVPWQQKLVNWLADQPEVQDPYAFTSAEGELILCLLDIERNTSTSLLRQGLVEVLTGKRLAEDAFGSLARVQIPARYHAGIASVSSPGASFVATQLIAATYRCLEAAQRHGKAAIKSIEVY